MSGPHFYSVRAELPGVGVSRESHHQHLRDAINTAKTMADHEATWFGIDERYVVRDGIGDEVCAVSVSGNVSFMGSRL